MLSRIRLPKRNGPNFPRLIDQLKKHEGTVTRKGRHVVYNDATGESVDRDDLEKRGIATIGHGRNLVHRGLSDLEARFLLYNDIDEIHKTCLERYPYYKHLSSARKNAILELCFNMGFAGWDTFKNAQKHIVRGEWKDVHWHLLESTWSKQVGPNRSGTIAAMMRDNRWPN